MKNAARIKKLEHELKQRPSAQLLERIAIAYQEQDDLLTAKQYHLRAIAAGLSDGHVSRYLGDCEYGLGALADALACYTAARDAFDQNSGPDKKKELQAILICIGNTHLAMSEQEQFLATKGEHLRKALQAYHESVTAVAEISGLNERERNDMLARGYLNIGHVYDAQGDQGDLTRARTQYQLAYELSRKVHDFQGEIRALCALARMDEKEDRLETAIQRLDNAHRIAESVADPQWIADTLAHKGALLVRTHRWDSASAVLKKAYKYILAQKSALFHEQKVTVAKNLRILQAVHTLKDQIEAANDSIEALLKAQKFLQAAQAIEELGDLYCSNRHFSQPQKAVECYERVIQLVEKHALMYNVAPIFASLAITFTDMKKTDQAIEYYQKELDALDGRVIEQAKTLCEIGVLIADKLSEPNSSSHAVYQESDAIGYLLRSRALLAATPPSTSTQPSQSSQQSPPSAAEMTALRLRVEKALLKMYLRLEQPANAGECRLAIARLDSQQSSDEDGEEDSEGESDDDSTVSISEEEEPDERAAPRKIALDRRNEKGETALQRAAIQGNLSKLRELLKAGAAVNVHDGMGWTPLHEACNHGHLDIVEELLKVPHIEINHPGATAACEKITPLHDAVINGHLDIVKLLVKHKASLKARDASGKTPLERATDKDVFEFLKSAMMQAGLQPTVQEFTEAEDDESEETGFLGLAPAPDRASPAAFGEDPTGLESRTAGAGSVVREGEDGTVQVVPDDEEIVIDPLAATPANPFRRSSRKQQSRTHVASAFGDDAEEEDDDALLTTAFGRRARRLARIAARCIPQALPSGSSARTDSSRALVEDRVIHVAANSDDDETDDDDDDDDGDESDSENEFMDSSLLNQTPAPRRESGGARARSRGEGPVGAFAVLDGRDVINSNESSWTSGTSRAQNRREKRRYEETSPVPGRISPLGSPGSPIAVRSSSPASFFPTHESRNRASAQTSQRSSASNRSDAPGSTNSDQSKSFTPNFNLFTPTSQHPSPSSAGGSSAASRVMELPARKLFKASCKLADSFDELDVSFEIDGQTVEWLTRKIQEEYEISCGVRIRIHRLLNAQGGTLDEDLPLSVLFEKATCHVTVVVGQYEPKPACERFRSVFRRQLAREDLPGLLSEDLLGWEPVLADVFKAEDQSLNFDGLALQSKAANLVFSVLRHSSALMHLDLSSNLLTDDDASTFALVCYALPHLRSLLLAGNQFSAKAVSAILSAPAPSSSTPKPFQALEELDLSYMSLDELSSSIGPSLHKIKRLNLSHCQLLPQNFRVAELLQTASSTLCHLSLAGNTELKFDAAARRAILSSHLRSLDVSSCYLDSDFFELASSVSEDEPPAVEASIKILNLSQAKIAQKNVPALAAFLRMACTQLEELDISGLRFSATEMDVLLTILATECLQLRTLLLCDSTLGHGSLDALDALLRRLVEADISHTMLPESMFARLLRQLAQSPSPALRTLRCNRLRLSSARASEVLPLLRTAFPNIRAFCGSGIHVGEQLAKVLAKDFLVHASEAECLLTVRE
eukprot:m.893194 g.893194  ORF g.893194 m.893194 type:complete len:1540 (-) comp59975_c0_seq36:744-5363(-)